jgi:hypothetical protein
MELLLAMQSGHGLSARRACRALSLSRSAPYYRPAAKDDAPVIDAISAYIAENPGQGFFLLSQTFRDQNKPWGARRGCGGSTAICV